MKTGIRIGLSLIIVWALLLQAQAQISKNSPPRRLSFLPKAVKRWHSDPSIVNQDADSRTWEQTNFTKLPYGRVFAEKHYYTELASGLNYMKNRRWTESKEEIKILPNGGAAATEGRHQVHFPGNIYNGFIESVTPDGKHLKSRPVGISYDDGDKTVLIAELKNSVGHLISSNQMIYPNAFTDFKADLVCTYRKSGFECDLVFREQPPAPEQFGLNSKSSRLQLLTEFFDTPEPVKTAGRSDKENGLEDTTLTFGDMTFIPGKSFAVGSTDSKSLPVYKSWLHIGNRTFLVEELPFDKIAPALQTLPLFSKTSQNSAADEALHKVSLSRLLPADRWVKTQDTTPIQLAKADFYSKKGVVLDYTTVDTSQSMNSPFTFEAGETYLVNGPFYLTSQVTFQGGTVIKFGSATNASIIPVNASIDCEASQYRPIILTSVDDNGWGEAIGSGSPRTNNQTYLTIANAGQITLKGLRIAYAQNALSYNNDIYNDVYFNIGTSGFAFDIWDCQFIHCGNLVVDGLTSDWNEEFVPLHPQISLHNVLISDCNYVRWDGAEQSTVDAHSVDAGGSVNCIVINRGNQTTKIIGDSLITDNPPTPLFQTVNGGNYYLPVNSPYHGVGSTGISSEMAAELHAKTTFPPVTTYNGESQLGPPSQVRRDTGSNPDIGYHYDPIDYMIGGGMNVTFLPGTVVGMDGLSLGSENFQGIVNNPCLFVAPDVVQESGGGNVGVYVSNCTDTYNLSARFTKFYGLLGDVYFTDWSGGGGSVNNITNCEFYGGDIGSGSYEDGYEFNNCLFVDTFLDIGNGNSGSMLNCTLIRGAISSQGTELLVENTAFDETAIQADTDMTSADHNAYADPAGVNVNQLPNDSSDQCVFTDQDGNDGYNWQTGLFGNYYNGSSLLDHGSGFASALGLCQFTTQTDNSKDTGFVDIGYHYVASDGLPANTTVQTCPDDSILITFPLDSNCGSTPTIAIITQPGHGSLSAITVNGSIASVTYTPNIGYLGQDSFAYHENDEASHSVTINVNNSLAASASVDSSSCPPDFTKFILSGSDQCGDSLTFAIVSGSGPSHGTLSAITQIDSTHASVIYTPNNGFVGKDSFSVTSAERGFTSAAYQVNIDVVNPNGATAPPASCGASSITFTLSRPNPCGNTYTFSVVPGSGPSHGTLSAITPIDANHARVTYTSNNGSTGVDGFDFVSSDGTYTSAPYHVTIKNGTWLQKWQTPGAVSSSPVISPDGQTIYVNSGDGQLYAFDTCGASKWQQQQFILNLHNIYGATPYANLTTPPGVSSIKMISSPVLSPDGNTIYVAAHDGSQNTVYAINSVDRTLVWSHPLVPLGSNGGEDMSVGLISPVLANDGNLYITEDDGTPGTLYAINHSTGAELWHFGNEDQDDPESSPAIGCDGTIYYTGEFLYNSIGPWGGLYAVKNNGTLKWRFPINTADDNHGNFLGFYSSPTIGPDGTIYVGSNHADSQNKYDFYAITNKPPLGSGAQKWLTQLGGITRSSPSIAADGTIYVGTDDGKLYAIDSSDGHQKWKFTTGGPIISSPALGQDGTIYVGSTDHNFFAINRDGSQKWVVVTDGPVVSSPAIGPDGTVYFGSCDGYVYSVQGGTPLANSIWPMFLKNTAHNSSEPSPAPPTGLTAIPSNEQIILNWNASGGATSYNVKRSTTSGGPYTTLTPSPTGTTFTDTTVACGPTYYVVSAINCAGEGANSSEIGPVTLLAPPSPTGLTAITCNNQIILNWNPSGGAASYNVKRSTTSGGPYTTLTPSPTGTTFTDTTVANGTAYYYVVSAVNCGESANSIQVGPVTPSPCNCLPPGAVAWWPAENNVIDIIGGNNGTLMNGAGFGSGEVGSAFSFNNTGTQAVDVPRSSSLNIVNQITIEFWMKADPANSMGSIQGLVTSDNYLISIDVGNPNTGVVGVDFGINENGTFYHTANANGGGHHVSAGIWHHIAGTYDGTKLQLYVDGQPWGNPMPHTGHISPMPSNGFLSIGSEDGRVSCGCTDRHFWGLIDEATIYNRALSAAEIQSIYNAGGFGKLRP